VDVLEVMVQVALDRRLTPLNLGSVMPPVLSVAEFRNSKLMGRTWQVVTWPWWDDTLVARTQSLRLSTKLTAVAKEVPQGASEEQLRTYLTQQFKESWKQAAAKEDVRSLAVVDTHQTPLLATTRNPPNFALLPAGVRVAALHNIVGVVSLKVVIDEDAAADLAAMLEEFLIHHQRRCLRPFHAQLADRSWVLRIARRSWSVLSFCVVCAVRSVLYSFRLRDQRSSVAVCVRALVLEGLQVQVSEDGGVHSATGEDGRHARVHSVVLL
jgi:hypothetical protein